MANVKCRDGKEIDLLAMNPKSQERFHVEARVTRTGFKIIRHDTYVNKGRFKGIPHRIGLDFFDKEKFEHSKVKEKIADVFGKTPYKKILVVWDVKDPTIVPYAKEKYGINIWLIRDLLENLGKYVSGSRDDVLRLAELFYHSGRIDRYEMKA